MPEVTKIIAEYIARLLWWSAIFAFLVPLEMLLPQGPRQPFARRLQGLVFWVLWLAAASALMLLWGQIWHAVGVRPLAHLDLEKLSAWAGPAAAALSVLLGVVIADLTFYWFHRAQHAWPWLWRLHSTHHAIRDMSAVNSYHHVSEVLVRAALTTLPLSWLTISAADLPLLSGLFALQVVAIHSPTRLHLGPLRQVLADNRFHRIHHSLEPRHFNKNFAANFTFLDRLFGTAYFPADDEWPDVGLAETPEPDSVRAWLAAPFAAKRTG